MQVDVRVGSLEQSVLIPFRLPDAQNIAGGLHGGDVGWFIGGVREHKKHVDNRLGGKSGNCCLADVFELEDSIAKYSASPVRFAPEPLWPIRIVLDKADWRRQRLELSDRDGLELLIRHWAVRFPPFFFPSLQVLYSSPPAAAAACAHANMFEYCPGNSP